MIIIDYTRIVLIIVKYFSNVICVSYKSGHLKARIKPLRTTYLLYNLDNILNQLSKQLCHGVL